MNVRVGGAEDGRPGGNGGRAGAGPERVVGRAGELSVVTGLAGEVAAGVGGVLVVAGEQGIGKSALLRAGLSRARGGGVPGGLGRGR